MTDDRIVKKLDELVKEVRELRKELDTKTIRELYPYPCPAYPVYPVYPGPWYPRSPWYPTWIGVSSGNDCQTVTHNAHCGWTAPETN